MTPDDLQFILQKGEGLRIEFKETVRPSLAREFVAMANASGGRVLLGVRDDGAIVGIDFNNRLRSRVQDIANNCEPPVTITFEALADIVVVHVPEGADKPYQCADGFFLRTGANSQKLDREEIAAFLRAEGFVRFEEQFHRRFDFSKHYAPEKLAGYLRLAGITPNLDEQSILENLGVGFRGQDTFRLNFAGILLFSNTVNLLCEQATITCAVFDGIERIHVANRKDYAEDLVNNIDSAMRFVRQELRVRYEMTGGPRRREVYEIPLDAIREAIVNAVMHRDYAVFGAHTTVELFDDRLEIGNPGGLVKGLTPDMFGRKAIRRNQLIASLLHRIDFVENMGTGINKIRGLLSDAGCPDVQFEFNEFFTAVFQRRKEDSINGDKSAGLKIIAKNDMEKDPEKSAEAILELLRDQPHLKIFEIAEKLSISTRAVEKQISNLRGQKRLRRVGSRKKGHWEVGSSGKD